MTEQHPHPFDADCVHCPPSTPPGDNIVAQMFAWWNIAYVEDRLDQEGFGRFFADDAVFLIDGTVRARGPAELVAYFRAIRAATESVVLHPPEDSFVADDRVFVHYRTKASIGGQIELGEVMAAARVSNGKIAFYKAIRRALVGDEG